MGLAVAIFGVSAPALATPCPAPSSCTAGGITFTETGGTSGSGLTFLVSFPTANQSNSTIAADVLAFLTAQGYSDALYLGRQDGTGLIGGDKVTTSSSNSGLSGTWTFTPGSTTANYVGAVVAIHAGSGQSNEQLFQINNPGFSGTWATMSDAGLSNFDLFGIDPPTPVPEPLTLSIFGAGIVGAVAMRRRLRARRRDVSVPSRLLRSAPRR